MRNWPSPNLKNRWIFFVLTYIYVITLYIFTNHYTFRPTHFLPLTFIDLHTPFLPWTGWIYVLVYIFPLSVGFIVDRDDDVKLITLAFVAMSTVCTLVFFFYPTVYPRPALLDGSGSALALVRLLDTPANCLPSQHVALGFLAAFFIRHYRKLEGNLSILLAILIAISTLTTKQHYIWDVLTGYFLARIIFQVTNSFMTTPEEAAQ